MPNQRIGQQRMSERNKQLTRIIERGLQKDTRDGKITRDARKTKEK